MPGKLLANSGLLCNPVLPAGLGGCGGAHTVDEGGQIVGRLIGSMLGGFLIFAFIFAFFYLILGGLSWITSSGDKGHLENARNKITHAILGLVIVAAAWAIMTLVGSFLGISFPRIPFPTVTTSGVQNTGGTNAPANGNADVGTGNSNNPRFVAPAAGL